MASGPSPPRRRSKSNSSAIRQAFTSSGLSDSAAMTAPASIAVTIGEPAGIGPDLCVRLAERTWPVRLVLIGDIELVRERARRLGAGVRFVPYAKPDVPAPGAI